MPYPLIRLWMSSSLPHIKAREPLNHSCGSQCGRFPAGPREKSVLGFLSFISECGHRYCPESRFPIIAFRLDRLVNLKGREGRDGIDLVESCSGLFG
ncbi:hypothetical protein CDAR_622821 [Caerostris darwini]|uniref:Uncharacterized protein n=1 Tax=Caerostris darwini TaxID=1538125 RepID=A0AAV4WIX7_9ARAC|nr:hypothetical protein CDAR_622821 [Caerostris darwini]